MLLSRAMGADPMIHSAAGTRLVDAACFRYLHYPAWNPLLMRRRTAAVMPESRGTPRWRANSGQSVIVRSRPVPLQACHSQWRACPKGDRVPCKDL